MKKIHVTDKPTHIIQVGKSHLYLSWVPEEPDELSLFDLVVEYYLPALFFASGWIIALALLLFPINVV